MTQIGVVLSFLGDDHEVSWDRTTGDITISDIPSYPLAAQVIEALEGLDVLLRVRDSLGGLRQQLVAQEQLLQSRVEASKQGGSREDDGGLPTVSAARTSTQEQPTIPSEHHGEVRDRASRLYAAAAGAGVPVSQGQNVQPGMGVPGVSAAQLLTGGTTPQAPTASPREVIIPPSPASAVQTAADPTAVDPTTLAPRRRRSAAPKEPAAPAVMAPMPPESDADMTSDCVVGVGATFRGKKVLQVAPVVHNGASAYRLNFGMEEFVIITPGGDVLQESHPTATEVHPEQLPEWATPAGLPAEIPTTRPQPAQAPPTNLLAGFIPQQPQVVQQAPGIAQAPMVSQATVAPQAQPSTSGTVLGLTPELMTTKRAIDVAKYLLDTGVAHDVESLAAAIGPHTKSITSFAMIDSHEALVLRLTTVFQLISRK